MFFCFFFFLRSNFVDWLSNQRFCLKKEEHTFFCFFCCCLRKNKNGLCFLKIQLFFFLRRGAPPLRSGLRPTLRSGAPRRRKKKLIFKNKAHFLFFSETATKKTKERLYSSFLRQKSANKKKKKRTSFLVLKILFEKLKLEIWTVKQHKESAGK